MCRRPVWIAYMYVMFSFRVFNCVPVLLPNYKVSLYSEDQRLSTLLWLRPAYCLYEEWMVQALDPSVANRKTSSISVQVQMNDDNTTFVLPKLYKIPHCSPMFKESRDTDEFGYIVGPNIENLNGTSVQRIMPRKSYRFRYMLHNAAKTQLAYTNWSEFFQTSDVPLSPNEMSSSLQGRSGGMVVITVLLSISMFLLLAGLALTFGARQH